MCLLSKLLQAVFLLSRAQGTLGNVTPTNQQPTYLEQAVLIRTIDTRKSSTRLDTEPLTECISRRIDYVDTKTLH